MTRKEGYHPALFWLAVATAIAAMLPIVVGALVTTRGAGMAFPDWPTSDGHNMFAYRWMQSAGDKFVEHGHRLAGIFIGCMSIVLAVTGWILERRRWVRLSCVAVLGCVIVQGLLGGGRVLADERLLAMFHGAFAAAVFSLIASVALFESRSWLEPPADAGSAPTRALKLLAILLPFVIVLQYSLGGLVRHLGTALYEHIGTAFIVLICAAVTVIAAHRTRCSWLRRPADWMGIVALCQVLLGGASFVTKYGLAQLGYVAVVRSPLQTAVRTSHTVVGMLLLMTSVLLLLRVLRAEFIRGVAYEQSAAPASSLVPTRLQGGLS